MLELLFGPPGRLAAAYDSSGWPTRRSRTQAGVVVDEDIALTYAAVWCATRIICETVAGLPIAMYRRLPNNERTLASDDYRFELVKSFPNHGMGSMAFREGRTMHQVNWGNGFGEIERERFGDYRSRILGLYPIHPSRVQPVRPADNRPGYGYLVRNNDGRQVAMRAEEVLHIPGCLTEDGVWGKGVVSYARECIGFGIGTERHGGKQFGSGNMPSLVVHGPGMRDQDARKNFRQEWKDIHGHPDGENLAILPIESKIEKLNFSNLDAQFIQNRKYNVTEIARWYRLPPHVLADLDRSTNNNIEQQGLELIIYSFFPWVRRWEEALNMKLLAPEERNELYFEHNFAALLRGDIGSRMTSYRTAIMIGLLSINECRRLENLNGIGPAGDVHYVPLNMTTAEQAALGYDEPGRGPGSDQSGAPGDNAAEFDAWMRQRMKKAERQALRQHLGELERRKAGRGSDTGSADGWRAAGEKVLADALGRMFTKEANAAKRALVGGSDVEGWMRDFYPRHRDALARALQPAAEVLRCAGSAVDAGTLADRVIASSRAELVEAFNRETRSQFLARLDSWPSERAQREAGLILKGDSR